ncbi:TPA: hypothetical protein PTV31_003162 [Clostridium botulinum]|nr:hypothetical protein [Clostridium botulinum]
MEKINLDTLENIIDNNSCAFLCGNGMSINFDKSFGTIFNRLYEAHKILIKNGIFKTKSNSEFRKKNMTNYNEILQYIKYSKEDEILKIFKDALIFAQSIIENSKLVDILENSKQLITTTFGIGQLDLVKQICYSGKRGVEYVNIEYWTILIHFYFLIKELNLDKNIYDFPDNNIFITLVHIGDKSTITLLNNEDIKEKLLESTLFNGFNIYYRLLFCIAIFDNGKAINYNKLGNIKNIYLNKLQSSLNKFNAILTLNYDRILDLILNKQIYHLHGKFVLNKEEVVANQILGLEYNNNYISFSDILIGDYFYNKTQKSMVNTLAGKDYVNKKTQYPSKIIGRIIHEKNIDTFFIMGMSIQNDQHIIRLIMSELYFNKVHNPKIVYGYYEEKDMKDFNKIFYEVINFSEELNEYAQNIDVKYIDIKPIISIYKR